MTGGKEKTMDMSIVTEGFLYKQGKLVKNWKKRWCCLYPNRLLYYDSKSNADKMKKPLGEVLIGVDSLITPDTLPSNGVGGCPQDNAADCCFAIVPKPGGRAFYFVSENREEMVTHWLSKLKQVQQMLIADPRKAHQSIRVADASQLPTSEKILEKSVYSSLQEAIHFASELRDTLARSQTEENDRLAMCYQLSERLQDAMEIFETVCEHPEFVFESGEKGGFVTARPNMAVTSSSSSSSITAGSTARSSYPSLKGHPASRSGPTIPSPSSSPAGSPSQQHQSSSLGGSRMGAGGLDTPPPPLRYRQINSPKKSPNSARSPRSPRSPNSARGQGSSRSPGASRTPPQGRGDVGGEGGELSLEDEEEYQQMVKSGSKLRKKKKSALPTFQQDLFVPEEKKENLEESEANRFKKKVESEIIASEKVYNQQIKILMSEYVTPLSICMEEAGMAKEYQLTLFGNINDIYRESCELLEGLEKAEKEGRSLADVMIEQEEPILRAYAHYVSNYHTAVSLLGRIQELATTTVSKSLKKIETDLRDKNILPLLSLLIQPVQRCPRYVLLLKNALNYTPVVHPDWNGYRIVVNKYERLAETVNHAKTTNEHLNDIIKIQKQISGNTLNLAEPGRKFIHSGSVIVKTKDRRPGFPTDAPDKPVYKDDEEVNGSLFLFSDTLLFTNETSKSSLLSSNNSSGVIGELGEFVNQNLSNFAYQFVGFLLLETLEVVDVEDDDFVLGFRYKGQGEKDTYYIETHKSDDKQKWLDAIAEQQELLSLVAPSRGFNDTNTAIVKSGWFHKRGNIIKTVNRRWFTLQGNTLFYFQDEHEKNPRGSINLLEYTLDRDVSEDKGKLLCVRISHTEKRNFWVWFESPSDLQGWLDVLTPNVLMVNMNK